MRTTVDIDPVILEAVRARQVAEGRTLGAVVSELLARALADDRPAGTADFVWATASLRPRVDLEDKDAVAAILDRA